MSKFKTGNEHLDHLAQDYRGLHRTPIDFLQNSKGLSVFIRLCLRVASKSQEPMQRLNGHRHSNGFVATPVDAVLQVTWPLQTISRRYGDYLHTHRIQRHSMAMCVHMVHSNAQTRRIDIIGTNQIERCIWTHTYIINHNYTQVKVCTHALANWRLPRVSTWHIPPSLNHS